MVDPVTRVQHDPTLDSVDQVEYAAPVVSTNNEEIEKKEDLIEHVDHAPAHAEAPREMAAGLGVIEQRRAIPLAGKRKPTTKKEYWSFIFFNMYSTACPLGSAVQNIRQMLLVDAHPTGFMPFAGSSQPVNTVLLDINGILAAAGLVLMFIIGPYADYGNWRPWILIVTLVIAWSICFGMLGIKNIDQWQIANVLWAIGNLTGGVVGIFYQATYPGLARDLPSVIQSEEDVLNGLKTPEEHDKLDSMERAQLFNYASIFSAAAGLVMYGVALGLAKALEGDGSPEANLRAYHWLIVFYTPLSMIFALPYLCFMQWRPGSAVPAGITMWTTGPRQVIYAAKSIMQLKQTLLYLVAYVFLWEAIGAYITVYAILLLENAHYSPQLSTAFTLVGDVAGGLGTIGIQLLHKRYGFKIKWIIFFGSLTSNFPNLWGAIGSFTNKIGYHHSWEFWFFQVWNVFTACAATYNVTMISEVVPASKLFMFYSLFKTIVGGTGFSGPFIVAAIIKQANGNSNVAFWFLLGIGLISTVIIYFVDTDKAKVDCAIWAEREAQERYTEEQRVENKANVDSDPAHINLPA